MYHQTWLDCSQNTLMFLSQSRDSFFFNLIIYAFQEKEEYVCKRLKIQRKIPALVTEATILFIDKFLLLECELKSMLHKETNTTYFSQKLTYTNKIQISTSEFPTKWGSMI